MSDIEDALKLVDTLLPCAAEGPDRGREALAVLRREIECKGAVMSLLTVSDRDLGLARGEGFEKAREQAAKDCDEQAQKIVDSHTAPKDAPYMSDPIMGSTTYGRLRGLRQQSRRIRDMKPEGEG